VIVDVHGHISPPEALKRFPMPAALGDVEGMIERKLAAGIGLTIVGSPVGAGAMVPIPGIDNYTQPASMLAGLHEWLAGTCADHPEHLRAYVYVNPFGSDAELAAAASTLRDNAFVGLIVNTSVRGEYLDSERAEPFFAMAAEVGAPVLLHPPAAPAAGQGLNSLALLEQVGRFCDVTAGLACCIFGGWLDRHPGLRLIGSGAGGAIALLAEKLDLAQRAQHWGGAAPGPQLAHAPSEYLRRIWVDTASPSALSLRANLEVLGPDRVLFGSDSPPLATPPAAAIGRVRQLVDEAVLEANARQLFGLARKQSDGRELVT